MSNSPKKSLGQHWLHDQQSLLSIADAAELSNTDCVLEVGPGLGTLTRVLAAQSDRIVAVEYDHGLAQDLIASPPAENVTIVEHDILDYDLSDLPSGYKVVANIPYYLTSHLVRRLLEAENQPAKIVLLVQKEVAERITAAPGAMSILAVSAQFYAHVELGITVPAELFTPPPKVDSQVVILTPHETHPSVDRRDFFRIVRAGFGEKRKKLSNSLAGGLNLDKTIVIQIIERLQLNPNVRAQELSLGQWLALYEEIQLAS